MAFLRLDGEIDASEAPNLAEALERALDVATGVLVLDLEGVSFVDAAGMTAIISALRRADQAGSEVSVVSAGPRVRLVFQMTGNEVLLESSASLADVAIAASLELPEEDGVPDG